MDSLDEQKVKIKNNNSNDNNKQQRFSTRSRPGWALLRLSSRRSQFSFLVCSDCLECFGSAHCETDRPKSRLILLDACGSNGRRGFSTFSVINEHCAIDNKTGLSLSLRSSEITAGISD